VGFSGVKCSTKRIAWSNIVKKLKGVVEEDTSKISSCTHLVFDDPLTRTAKLCIAVSCPSVKIVSGAWLKACEMAGAFVNAEPHVLSGEQHSAPQAINTWAFNATASRKAAAEGPGCLSGFTFHATANTMSNPEIMMSIIQAAGGTLLPKPPTASSGSGVLVVSTEEDDKVWKKLGSLPSVAAVLDQSHVLNCVLKQALDTDNGRLEA